jgi:molybdate transport repressor ModE-like protein
MQGSIQLDDLRLLLAISNAGTLTGAARRLGVDHSTAFRRLGALENRLGTRLFERARDGYAPTPAGEAAITVASRLDEDLSDLERRLAGEDLRPSGVVRVATTDTLIALLTPTVAAFRTAQPGILLEIVAANAFFTLTRRDADIAIRPAATVPEGLVARRIAAVETAIYGARSYLGPNPATGLLQRDWLGVEDSLAHLGAAKWLENTIPPERIVYRANSLVALQEAARAGIGLAALPCFMADRDPLLRRIQPPLPQMAASLWLITHPDLRRAARIRTVLDFMAVSLGKHRALLEGRAHSDT